MADGTIYCDGCGITLRAFMPRCPRCGTMREVSLGSSPVVAEAAAPQSVETAGHTQGATKSEASVSATQTAAQVSGKAEAALPDTAMPITVPLETIPIAPAAPLAHVPASAKTNTATAAPLEVELGPRTVAIPLIERVNAHAAQQLVTEAEADVETAAETESVGAIPLAGSEVLPTRRVVPPMPALGAKPVPPSELSDFSVVVSPPDEVRRFPLFTQAQLGLLLAGLALLVLGLLIGYLVWSRERQDSLTRRGQLPNASPTPRLSDLLLPDGTLASASGSPLPAASVDPLLEASASDQQMADEIRKALTAYNPTGVARYAVRVKDGIVTLSGLVDHQPEKEGAGNVAALVAGVKKVVNEMSIRADGQNVFVGAPVNATAIAPTPTPATVAATTPPAAPQNTAPAEPTATAQESARLQQERETEALRQREAEQQRQQEQLRAAEQARQERERAARQLAAQTATTSIAPPPTATIEQNTTNKNGDGINPLRSGTIAWSGTIDGVDEIVISGNSASVRHVNGAAVQGASASFSAPAPRAPVTMRLVTSNGRGSIEVVQQPSPANGYTTIVRIDDSATPGAKLHQFTLRWTMR